MGIFRSKPKQQPSSPTPAKNAISDRDRAQLELKRQRDRLKKYSKGMENTIAKESQIARQLLNKGEKKKAILILKKKKMQETMLERVAGQLLNVEKLIMDIDDAVVSKQVFEALRVGSDALKAINDEMSIDEIEDILEDSAESIRIQEEISTALSTNLNQDEIEELESEVDRMFAEMEAEEEKDIEKAREEEEEKAREEEEKALKREAELAKAEAVSSDVSAANIAEEEEKRALAAAQEVEDREAALLDALPVPSHSHIDHIDKVVEEERALAKEEAEQAKQRKLALA